MFEFNFNSKDEYLQQKKVWYFIYKKQVQKIRMMKLYYKDAQRDGTSVSGPMSKIIEARKEMDQLVKIRQDARLEAGRQYDAQHA